MARKAHDLNIYGVEYYNNREKDRKTKLERYGDEHYCNGSQISKTLRSKSQEEKELIEEKRGRTKLEKYGNRKYNNSKKARETNLKKYGTTSPAKNRIVLEKAKRTNLERYGTEWPQLNEELIKERYEKYGCYSPHLRYTYDEIFFDSYWELCYYVYNKEILHNNIQRGRVFEYYINGKKHRYECDFLLENENIEIKGNQFLDENGSLVNIYSGQHLKEKEECMRKNNVKILSKKDLQPIIKIVSKRYPDLKETACASGR